jgi:hypothetical protein
LEIYKKYGIDPKVSLKVVLSNYKKYCIKKEDLKVLQDPLSVIASSHDDKKNLLNLTYNEISLEEYKAKVADMKFDQATKIDRIDVDAVYKLFSSKSEYWTDEKIRQVLGKILMIQNDIVQKVEKTKGFWGAISDKGKSYVEAFQNMMIDLSAAQQGIPKDKRSTYKDFSKSIAQMRKYRDFEGAADALEEMSKALMTKQELTQKETYLDRTIREEKEKEDLEKAKKIAKVRQKNSSPFSSDWMHKKPDQDFNIDGFGGEEGGQEDDVPMVFTSEQLLSELTAIKKDKKKGTSWFSW